MGLDELVEWGQRTRYGGLNWKDLTVTEPPRLHSGDTRASPRAFRTSELDHGWPENGSESA